MVGRGGEVYCGGGGDGEGEEKVMREYFTGGGISSSTDCQGRVRRGRSRRQRH